MMTKVFIVVFGMMTLTATYLTATDVGVMEPSIKKHSVRQGSVYTRSRVGGYRRGK